MKIVSSVILCCLVLCLAGSGWAAVLYVDGQTASSGDGGSWPTAFKTIQEALVAADELTNDEIWVKQGTYIIGSEISVGKAVAIYGGFDGTESQRDERDWKNNVTMVDGDYKVRCFYVTADARIDGLTIANGYSEVPGAGIQNFDCSPIITNCILLGNDSTELGGGVYNNGSHATITNCTFWGNTAVEMGGGIGNTGSYPTITNCTFYVNGAQSGGGIGNLNSSPVITNCILWGDNATNGQEIYNQGSCDPNVTYCNIDQDGYAGSNGNIRQDPLFSDPSLGDFHLQGDSPCIDGGNNIPNLPDTDFEGDLRIMDGNMDGDDVVDMGADERGSVWFVDGDDGLDPVSCSGGDTWDNAFRTIQKAINCASGGDAIWVKAATYKMYTQINVGKPVAIYGGFAGDESQRTQRDLRKNATIIDGGGSVRCLQITADCLIDGFVITRGNGGTSVGGGIYVFSASPLISKCKFSENSSYSAGAIYCYSSSPVLNNCSFANNLANNDGGAIKNHNSNAVMTNCTFTGNSAGDGGAVYNSNSSPIISNCILWGDSPSEILNAGTSSPSIIYSDVQGGYSGEGNIEQDPKFIGNGDIHLRASSPCIDAGTSNGAPREDFDGDQRPQGKGYDMGADEYVGGPGAMSWLMLLLGDN